MPADPPVPAGFVPYTDAGAFLDHVGPLHVREEDGTLGARVRAEHLNAAGTAMGGFLATVVDAALGHAIRRAADGEPKVATVSLTTDFLRPGPEGAWIEARTAVEQVGGELAFADCSLHAAGDEIVRARAVFAVRS
ncbi:PaaI family thioesterase [Patulibacter sp.]|uniref:PaaI family thioesterase n=1 Tax=Patulibacter sp. TaxID=1912859 RepID=UPI00271F7F37|nr:PaaI family thioesterase [Patulibacter sp.]MDO9410907.1 PaaI family thioesterase [Patulibacter sp.]